MTRDAATTRRKFTRIVREFIGFYISYTGAISNVNFMER